MDTLLLGLLVCGIHLVVVCGLLLICNWLGE